MTFAVIVFPGSNCDHDAYHAAKHVLGQDARFVWHKETSLAGADVVILPGGFSHGDYLRTGAIARAQAPAMPASPLAGGMAAVGGGYVDAHGNPIVIPASYGEPCYDGYGGMCPPGYGDPSAGYVDFGGYAPDQCGPYYFDIALQTVWLTPEDFFEDVPPLASV